MEVEELIYNQRNIPKDRWRYGLRSSAAVGCGWIATCNALRLLGRDAEPEELIRFYERQLPLIHGNAGTTLFGPALYFRHRGFPVELVLRRQDFDRVARESDVCILFYRWRKGLKLGAHFVALHHTEGGFLGYNTYRNSTGPDRYGTSLDGFLRRRKYFGAVLIGIRTRPQSLPSR